MTFLLHSIQLSLQINLSINKIRVTHWGCPVLHTSTRYPLVLAATYCLLVPSLFAAKWCPVATVVMFSAHCCQPLPPETHQSLVPVGAQFAAQCPSPSASSWCPVVPSSVQPCPVTTNILAILLSLRWINSTS